MADTVLVRPRTGLILAGIPAAGAAIPKALADEWLANKLVVRVELNPDTPVEAGKPPQGVVNARKRRRTR